MTREQAIEIVKSQYPHDHVMKTALGLLIPELRESDGERARRWLVNLVENLGEPADEDAEKELEVMRPLALSYLEKQKEQKDYRKLYEDIAKSEWFKKAYEGKSLGEPASSAAWKDEQKEQKPNSTEDMPYITDERFYEREPADSFKYKLAEYMTRCCTKKEGPYGYEYGISAESILKMAEEELLKRGVVQKPAWKPSEEQMEALAYASQVLGSDLSPRAAKASEELEGIREHFKKL